MTKINIINKPDYQLSVVRSRYKDDWHIQIQRQMPEYDEPLTLSLILSSEELSRFKDSLDETT